MKKLWTVLFFLTACCLVGCEKSVETNKEEKKMTSIQNSLPAYEISPQEVLKKIEDKASFVLIDVRTLPELKQSGVLDGALHIPLNELSEAALTEVNIGQAQEIVVYCRSGSRSHHAYELLREAGFKKVKSMAGGIIAWQTAQNQFVDWSTVEKKKLLCMEQTSCVR